ncbi:MAG: leucyl aminopeptidase [Rhodospirillales bacterium]|nr:leucyl aminopeptidase [Rhodospirillales bacterium]
MKIAFSEIVTPAKGVVAVVVTEERTLGATGRGLDEQTGGALSRALAAGRFKGKQGTSTTIVAPHGLDVDAVILVGLGKPEKIDGRGLRALGGSIVRKMNAAGAKAGAVAVDAVDGASIAPPSMAAEIALGARLGSYSFDKYHTKKKDEDKKSLGELTVMLDEPAVAEDAFEANANLADGVFTARDLVSEPSNVKYPKTIAEDIEALTADGIEVELLDHDKMASLGMGSLLGVAQGSDHEPYLAIMRWNGAPEGAGQQPVAFIGKGVTFDTGGISIKPGQGMEEMKYDMAGSATVVGLMKCLAGRKARVNAVGLVGLVENMPDGKAQRPGDVVTSMSGQTIEVINTDAEGRLVLADVLWYAQATYEPRFMIDLATLTGAIIVSLGTYHAGLFSNDDELSERLIAAGKESGEEVWRMPLGDRYNKDIDSAIADMKNVGKGREAGSIAGAVFLERFVNGVPWAHLDIAGMAWMKGSHDPTVPKGASGYGVRLLDQLVRAHYEG